MIKRFEALGDYLESKRGTVFGDIVLALLEISNIYHNKVSSYDGSGIEVVTPVIEPEKYEQLNNY